MKYYLHDSNSFQDEKITKLYIKFGYEGLGLFYTLLEKIAAQEKPIENEVLKKQLNIGKKLEKVWDFMHEIGIISSKNGETFNENLLNFSEKYKIKKEKTRKKVKEWRERQGDKKDVTDYVPVSNPRKVKLSKVKENYIKEIQIFNKNWNLIKNKFVRMDNFDYEKFVKFLFGENDLKRNLIEVLKLKDQISFDDYIILQIKINILKGTGLQTSLEDKIYHYINGGYKGKSFFLTMNNWINNDFKKRNLTLISPQKLRNDLSKLKKLSKIKNEHLN